MAPTKPMPLDRLDPAEAWRPWQPSSDRPWNLKWAGHLFRRAAFCPSWDELQLAVKQGPDRTLDQIINGGEGLAEFDELVDDSTKGLGSNSRSTTLTEYQAVWTYRMVHTPHPLRERMTLFWHNHFATSITKVRQPVLMERQVAVMRKHALDKFQPLLLEMSRDPAMLIWLDSNSNIKGRANENFAREIMELFSLGIGNYTEKDIQEAARAFTGWHTSGGEYIFNAQHHDDGAKTVFGKTGNWNGNDIVRFLLEQPAAGRFLARKLYRHLISEVEVPPDRLIEPLAEQLRKSQYDIGALVRTILRSRHFFSEYAYRQRIKSPVEYVVGLIRSLGGQVPLTSLANTMDGMGQGLYSPPSVKGWDGGEAWLNSATILARHNSAWNIVGGENAVFQKRVNPAELTLKTAGKEPDKEVSFLLNLFVQEDVGAAAPKKLAQFLKGGNPKDAALDKRLREVTHTVLLLPEYQLA